MGENIASRNKEERRSGGYGPDLLAKPVNPEDNWPCFFIFFARDLEQGRGPGAVRPGPGQVCWIFSKGGLK